MRKNMKKIYLIDSENVNDAWVELLPVLEGGDRITVFYTDKSPHMCYQHVIALLEKEREIRFIKCFEGNNALDFQLVSELGYMLCEMPDYEYVIVSNDTGFDAIVKYWEKRGRKVSRIKGRECRAVAKKASEKQPFYEETKGTVSFEAEEGETFIASCAGEPAETEEPGEPGELREPEESAGAEADLSKEPEGADELTDIFKANGSEDAAGEAQLVCDMLHVISLHKMALFHNALTCMFDQKTGDEVYAYIKKHRADYRAAPGTYISKKKERERYYIGLALSANGLPAEMAQELHKILYSIPKKELKSLNNAIIKKYGRDEGAKYYAVLKKHLKVIGKL